MNDAIRYSRQTTLPAIGVEGQAKLRDASVLIVGAGGLGVPAATYLASAGVGQLLINDFDTIDLSNLPRQILYREEDVDSFKARVAAERLHELNPAVDVVALDERMDRTALEECIDSVDAVLDCSDNFTTRWMVNEACHQHRTPFVSGSAIRWEGQLTVFRFDEQLAPCYRCLYSEEDENLQDCAGQGIVAPVAGTVGTMMATETIKLLLGLDSDLSGQLWIYDALAGNSRSIRIARQDNCPVCG